MKDLTNYQVNLMKDLMGEPHATTNRAISHFTSVCGKYNIDPKTAVKELEKLRKCNFCKEPCKQDFCPTRNKQEVVND